MEEEVEPEASHRREKAAMMMTCGMCHGASQLFHYYHAITDLTEPGCGCFFKNQLSCFHLVSPGMAFFVGVF